MTSLSRLRAFSGARRAAVAVIVVTAAAGVLRLASLWHGGLPPRLSDDAFWRLVSELSEPGGSFMVSRLRCSAKAS